MELKIDTHDDEIQVVLDALNDEQVACERIERENPELNGLTRGYVIATFIDKVEKELEKYQ